MVSQMKKNYLYNVLYQVLILVMPLVTIPYVSRILGADGVGIYSYTYSIAYYFVLIAMLGINNYGNRTIAKNRQNKEQLSTTFWGIYSIQLIMSAIMIALYVFYALTIENRYPVVTLVQLIYVISVIFDINWFFFGMEKFKVTVTRNIIIKILSIFCIFIFVDSADDLWLYTLIMAGGTFLSQIILWPFLLREIEIPNYKKIHIKSHIKPCLVLFIPVVAVSLYKVMDKMMLGVMADISELGYYEQAEKITTFPIAFITAVGTVMLPRMSNLMSKNMIQEIRSVIGKAMDFMMFLAYPIVFGLIAVSDSFVPLYMGDSFMKSSILLSLLSVTIIFISLANAIKTGFMLPKVMDKAYATLTIVGAVVNLIINLLLIPSLQSVGACIGTIVAEFVVMVMQLYYVRKYLPVVDYVKSTMVFLLKGLVMFAMVWPIRWMNLPDIQMIVAQVVVGVAVYAVLNYNYIRSLINPKFGAERGNING